MGASHTLCACPAQNGPVCPAGVGHRRVEVAGHNAIAESLFASLETELIDRSVWRAHDEARLAIFDYIEIFYNRARLHSALGYLSPDQFERRYRLSKTSEKTTAA
jgi:transposase InsO family protein